MKMISTTIHNGHALNKETRSKFWGAGHYFVFVTGGLSNNGRQGTREPYLLPL